MEISSLGGRQCDGQRWVHILNLHTVTPSPKCWIQSCQICMQAAMSCLYNIPPPTRLMLPPRATVLKLELCWNSLEDSSYTDCLTPRHFWFQRVWRGAQELAFLTRVLRGHCDALWGVWGVRLWDYRLKYKANVYLNDPEFVLQKRKTVVIVKMPYFFLLVKRGICYTVWLQSYRQHWFWSLVIMFEVITWTGFLVYWKYFR